MFFTLIFGDNFFITNLANCVRDESCRGKIAPNQDAAFNPAHRCTL